MEENEYREKFMEQLSSSYGQVETMLGTEGYKIYLESHKADKQRMMAYTDRQRSITSAIHIGSFLGILVFIPVIVFLWKWAINY
jgi:hypothetical protein